MIWLVVLPAVQMLQYHGQLFSSQFIIGWLILLPIFLLGSYLTGNWRWKDFEKKYPD
jgi:hypothetical protein